MKTGVVCQGKKQTEVAHFTCSLRTALVLSAVGCALLNTLL